MSSGSQEKPETPTPIPEDILNVVQSGQVKASSAKLRLLMGSSSDEDEDEGKESVSVRVQPVSQAKGHRGRAHVYDDGDGEDGFLSDGFDAELYGDSEDRMRLAALPEVEREAILYERAQARQARQERRALEQKIREREMGVEAGSSGDARRSPSAAADAKRRRLEELRSQRQKKSRRKTVDDEEDGEYYEDEDEDEDSFDERGRDDSADEEEYGSRRRTRKEKSVAAKQRIRRSGSSQADYSDEEDEELVAAAEGDSLPLDLEYANKLRLSRDILAEWMYRDGLAEVAPRCLLRINIGTAQAGGPPVYRVVELRKFTTYHHTYFLKPGHPTDQAVLVRFAKSERTFRLDIISNAPFTAGEFEHWKRECDKAGCKLPYATVGAARRKTAKLKAFHSQPLDDSTVEAMIARRRALFGADGQLPPRNLLAEQMILRQQLREATERDIASAEEIARIESELAAIVSATLDKTSQSSLAHGTDRMEALNRRNRQVNLLTGRTAEISRVAGESNGAGNSATLDPFQRRKCKPTIIHMGTGDASLSEASSGKDSSVAASTATATPAASPTKPAAKTEQPAQDIFDVHQALDIDLDI